MKDQEIQIGCTYRVTKGEESRIVTIKDKAELIASLYLNDKGRIEPIVLDSDELVRLGLKLIDSDDDHGYYLQSIDLFLDRSFQPCGIGEYTIVFERVHQLQQLFQALTGENLPYNEK